MNVCIVLYIFQKLDDSGMRKKYVDDYSLMRSESNDFPKFRGCQCLHCG